MDHRKITCGDQLGLKKKKKQLAVVHHRELACGDELPSPGDGGVRRGREDVLARHRFLSSISRLVSGPVPCLRVPTTQHSTVLSYISALSEGGTLLFYLVSFDGSFRTGNRGWGSGVRAACTPSPPPHPQRVEGSNSSRCTRDGGFTADFNSIGFYINTSARPGAACVTSGYAQSIPHLPYLPQLDAADAEIKVPSD